MNLPGVTDLKWSEPKRINTHEGPMLLKKATPTPAFWDLWKKYKESFTDVGFTVSEFPKDSGQWTINWWDRGRGFSLPILVKQEPRGQWHNVKTTPPPLNVTLFVRAGPRMWTAAFDGRKWEGVGASRGEKAPRKKRKKKGDKEEPELIPKFTPFDDEGDPREWYEPAQEQ